MNINQYLLKNHDYMKALYTKIFGKYLIRYYDTSGYVVDFNEYASTSYQDSKNKVVMIAKNNVIAMLKKNVNALAVAYHELAHILYTDDNVRNNIQKKTKKAIIQLGTQRGIRGNAIYMNTKVIHNIWNVLEDTRIERLMVKEFPFLKDIIEPLKTIIEPNGDKLLEWRVGNNDKSTPSVVENAEAFCLEKKQTQIKLAEYIANIYVELYERKVQPEQQPSSVYQPLPFLETDKQKAKQLLEETDNDKASRSQEQVRHDLNRELKDASDSLEYMKDNIKYYEERAKKHKESGDLEASKTAERQLKSYQERIEELEISIEDLKDKLDILAKEKEINSDLSQVEIDTNTTSYDSALLDMLEAIRETKIKDQQEAKYNESVIHDYTFENNGKGLYTRSVDLVYNPKQKLRSGISQARSKKFNMNLNNRISVPRIVSSQANHTQPNIFYNRGKDISFAKKVVIFEDISASTQHFEKMFSSIAYSLSKSFDSVEWWGYADKLFKKKTKDYKFVTKDLAASSRLPHGSTHTYRLSNVMEKYKNKDYTYVIITDGDMKSLFKSEKWKFFKDKTIVIGLLDKNIHDNTTYKIDLLHELAKKKGYTPRKDQAINDILNSSQLSIQDLNDKKFYFPVVAKGIKGVVDLVSNRLT